MVAAVAGYDQQALGLTDHGNMAGSVQLYRHATAAGLKPFPGTELYVVEDRNNKKAKRHHMCVVAYTFEGYQNLVNLNTLANENFHHKPLIDHADMAALHDDGMLKGIAATSGCYFGLISQSIVSGDDNYARVLMNSYDKWFDRFFVELQNHNIDHGDGWNDDMLADRLMELADELGLPCVLTQDSHYVDKADKPVHETMKRLVSFGPDPDDAVFPGDGFQLADTAWLKEHHHEKRYERGAEGLEYLLDLHELSIPQLDNYSYNIPFTTADPHKSMVRRINAEFAERGLSDRYMERLIHEYEIVKDTGMAGYLLLVAAVTDWCKENSVFYQARGSASGSILCWLLGITQVDPIKHGLRSERFISRDRTKPPDIDLDIEHDRRQDLIEWLMTRFSIHQIGTWAVMSVDGDEESSKGSLAVKYFSRSRAAGNPVNNWQDIPAEDKVSLAVLSDKKAYSQYGTHAAGLVVTTSDRDFNALMPTMKVASSKTFVTQYDMGDVEALGFVKLDVLGLKALSILHRCMENLGRDVFEGLDWIPTTDKTTYSMISQGRTDGVFQLEGWSARSGVKELKPTKLGDIIASMALFRKATMKSGATESYIRRRHKKESVPQRHGLLERVVRETYGIMVFQDQVIAILRELGMVPDDLTAFLKAVKASNSSIGDALAVIEGYRERILGMAQEKGIGQEDFEWLWSAIEGFAEYGFNKAHAAAYGLTAYRCAYLANHHPVEFFSAVLSVWAGSDKELQYVKAARARGISIRRPDVNKSGASYCVDPNGKSIRKGLKAIKGVGDRAAEHIVACRPESGYESLEQFCRLVGSKVSGTKAYMNGGDTEVGVFAKLMEAGAFGGLIDE